MVFINMFILYTHDEKKLLPKTGFYGRCIDYSIGFSEIHQ